jgi:molecular chaperone HtpG
MFMAKKQFKSESKRLLELMINSIYTHKEIFLRELISNASDAIDKLCYISLTDDKVGLDRDDFRIDLFVDKEKRTLTISDNGIGMTAEELDKNLGVIAKSGSRQFKQEMEKSEEFDIIGQFGVGFYSAFMVASKVEVISRAYGATEANMWSSEGVDGYTITPCEKETVGTEITLYIKPDEDGEDYSTFLSEHTLRRLIKKYSDYIRWPIYMDVTKSRQVESGEKDEDGNPKLVWEDYTEREAVNSRIPIWQRTRSEASDEECVAFYKEKFHDMEDPVSVIRVFAEGAVSYKALLFIPKTAPYDFYTRDYKAGLELYSSGVLIMERCEDLLPEHYRFVKGVVDSQDLSLNISREMLQHDRQLKVIAQNLEKKVRSELKKLQENDPEKYRDFFKSFGLQLKYGIVTSYGMGRDGLADLLMFYSSKTEKLITLHDYVAAMPESQKYIYYACGENIEHLSRLPQAEAVREKGYDILFLTDEIDEFVVKTLISHEEKEFRSVTSDDLGLVSEEEKKAAEEAQEKNQGLLDFVKETLGDKIAAAKVTPTLRSHPVCLTTQGPVSLEMERYYQSRSTNGELLPMFKAQRVLELNPEHSVFEVLKNAYKTDKATAENYVKMLYDLSLLLAGMAPEDPVAFTEQVSSLIAQGKHG